MVLFCIIIVLTIIVWYAMAGRAWLRQQSWACPFFDWIEPIERKLFQKSETLLIGRLMAAGGFLVTAYDALATFATGLDLTPVTDRLLSWVPQDMRPLAVTLIFSAIGLLISRLRKRTTKPIELVAAPVSDLPPQAAAAVAKADVAKQQAVAAVRAAA